MKKQIEQNILTQNKTNKFRRFTRIFSLSQNINLKANS